MRFKTDLFNDESHATSNEHSVHAKRNKERITFQRVKRGIRSKFSALISFYGEYVDENSGAVNVFLRCV